MHSLSARLLVLTIIFVMIAEVFIFIPVSDPLLARTICWSASAMRISPS